MLQNPPLTTTRAMQVELRLPAEAAQGEPARPVVVDTNVALDLLIFSDPRTAPCAHCWPKGAWPG